MSVLAPLLAWLALGLPAAAVFWRRGRPDLALAVLPCAGALAVMGPVVAAPWLGLGLAPWPWLSAGVALLLGAALATVPGGDAPPPAWREGPPARTAISLALLVTACATPLALGSELARGWPGFGWDGQVIWLVRARVLAESVDFPLALFAEPSLARGHWDYPLLFPTLLAWFLRVGGLELQQLALVQALLLGILPLATAAGLARGLGLPAAACVALAPLAVDGLSLYHFQAYADPLLVLLGVAGLAWVSLGALRGDRSALLAGGLSLAAAVSVKNEGVLWLAAGGTAVVTCGWLRGEALRRAGGPVVLAIAPGLLLLGLWQLTGLHLGAAGDLATQLRFDLIGERFGPLFSALAGHVLWIGTPPLVLGSLVALFALVPGDARARLRAGALLLAPTAVLLTGLFAVYLGTPHDLAWHIVTSLHRTVYGVAPALVVAAACAAALRREA